MRRGSEEEKELVDVSYCVGGGGAGARRVLILFDCRHSISRENDDESMKQIQPNRDPRSHHSFFLSCSHIHPRSAPPTRPRVACVTAPTAATNTVRLAASGGTNPAHAPRPPLFSHKNTNNVSRHPRDAEYARNETDRSRRQPSPDEPLPPASQRGNAAATPRARTNPHRHRCRLLLV
jgi:hypothetical protein